VCDGILQLLQAAFAKGDAGSGVAEPTKQKRAEKRVYWDAGGNGVCPVSVQTSPAKSARSASLRGETSIFPSTECF
jgi:hypothetical protein